MQTKNMTVQEMGDSGKGLAMIADLTKVDSDGDSYRSGAFGWKEQWVPILAAHNRDMVPFGKARVFEEGNAAYAELNINLNTQTGKEWHEALKFDLATGKPVQEWSYGYDALEFEEVFRGLAKGRELQKLDLHEISTVVRGAGVGTHTLSMKGLKAALKDGAFDDLIGGLGTLAETVSGNPSLLSATGRKQLEEIHASIGQTLSGPANDADAIAAIEREHGRYLTRGADRHVRRA